MSNSVSSSRRSCVVSSSLSTPSCLIYYQNCRGLNTKINQFFNNICDCTYDMICITETWLSDNTFNNELFPDCYNVVRCDRRFDAVGRSRGGGVLLALNNSIQYLCIDTSFLTETVPLVDVVICRCVSPFKFNICLVYIPPDVPVDDLEVLSGMLEVHLMDERTLFVGDFNLPNFVFESFSCTKTAIFLHLCNVLNLQQHNTVLNNDGKLLDLVLSDGHVDVSINRADSPVVVEDIYHPALEINIKLLMDQKQQNFPTANTCYMDFRRANCDVLSGALSDMDWTFLLSYDNVDHALDCFYKRLYSVLESHVPKKHHNSGELSFPIWFTHEIKQNIKTKSYYRKKWLATKNQYYLHEFKRLRTLIKEQISRAHSGYVDRMQNSIKSDVSMLWRYIDQKRGSSRIPGILYHNDSVLDNPQDIVNSFAQLFSETYITDDAVPQTSHFTYHPTIQPPTVTEDYLLSIMSRLSSKSTAGDDFIPSFIIRNCRHSFAKPLSILINLSLRLNVVPEKWKKSRVVPVFKKNDANQLQNYRPISILSNFAKIYEQVLYDCIYSGIRVYLSPVQHGFLNGRSTVTNLAIVTQYVCEHLDNRGQVDVIYTDLSHAFDTISHKILLSKLTTFGFSSSFVRLMGSYLLNRSAYVYYNGFYSPEYRVSSGVPQGSNLGPLLFVLYMDDLLSSLDCPALAYADDLKIYTAIKHPTDAALLQRNLDKISTWCDDNMLKLNITKCFKVSYTRRTITDEHTYTLHGIPLVAKTTICDLGVLFDSSLSFVPHIEDLCKSASRALGFVIRTSKEFTDLTLIRMLFFTFVMSKLDYASIIWYPIYITHAQSLERVLRRFLRFISYKSSGIYPPRGADLRNIMDEIRIGPLASRREHQAAMFLQKLICNKIDCPYLLSKVQFNVPRIAARSTDTFFLPTPHTNALVRAPVTIMCQCANKQLPDVFR